MATSAVKTLRPMAKNVSFTDESMTVHLADDASITLPIAWFPQLAAATADQRQQWELLGGGVGLHWEEIDEDISVPGLLGLPCQ